MRVANPFAVGDSVVLLNLTRQLALDTEGRPLRGKVVRVWWSECHVQLNRTPDLVIAHHTRMRRCPQLAYVRPSECARPTPTGQPMGAT